MTAAALADRLDALLPQTQCRRCGFDGCRPYAEALATGETAPNRCPPGGVATLAALAAELAITAPEPDRSVWPAERAPASFHQVARIDEAICIGCYKCVLACPVDAIIGTRKFLHTVLADDCSGCELCLPPCPVDCITMEPRDEAATLPPDTTPAVTPTRARRWRSQHDARRERLMREDAARDEARRQRRAATMKDQAQTYDLAAAIARARARKETPST